MLVDLNAQNYNTAATIPAQFAEKIGLVGRYWLGDIIWLRWRTWARQVKAPVKYKTPWTSSISCP
jgi:hypothetical protein